MTHLILRHIELGSLKCIHDSSTSLIKILGLPYGTISQRFARSQLCENIADHPSSQTRFQNGVFDATTPGPSSIQPYGSVKSDASNIPLPTGRLPDDEEQSEDCLNLSIHLPPSALSKDQKSLRSDAKLPVLIFIHGGAYFLGSGNRPYYSPINLLLHSIQRQTPVIFVSINYRLGALGFWHAQNPFDPDLIQENNGLHDQILALEWMRKNIGGFGGDSTNITALGQSAGGESLSVLSNWSVVKDKGLFRRAVMLSGTPVTMPAMTPEEHTDNFRKQAKKLDIRIKHEDGSERDMNDIAEEVIKTDINKIRDLAWVGSPCTQTPLFPFDKPSMAMMRQGGPLAWKNQKGRIEAQIVGTTTYDGGISYNMMSKDDSRKDHGKAFAHIAIEVLGPKRGFEICKIYDIVEGMEDPDALQRVCLFESGIGFFFGALAVAEANLVPNTYLQIFDLPNPFPGPISKLGKFATHTFDITTLLGGYDENQLPESYRKVVKEWRDRILDFVMDETAPCEPYLEQEGKHNGRALMIDELGVREVEREDYMENDRERRKRFSSFAMSLASLYWSCLILCS